MSAGGKAIGAEHPASTRLFLTVVALAVFTTVLTATMINLLIPLMRAEFGASAAQVGWVITGYALTYAIGVPLYGRISDLFGVRRVFALGLLGFAVGGLICAFAPSLVVWSWGASYKGSGERQYPRSRWSQWRRYCHPASAAGPWAWSPPAWVSGRR